MAAALAQMIASRLVAVEGTLATLGSGTVFPLLRAAPAPNISILSGAADALRTSLEQAGQLMLSARVK